MKAFSHPMHKHKQPNHVQVSQKHGSHHRKGEKYVTFKNRPSQISIVLEPLKTMENRQYLQKMKTMETIKDDIHPIESTGGEVYPQGAKNMRSILSVMVISPVSDRKAYGQSGKIPMARIGARRHSYNLCY